MVFSHTHLRDTLNFTRRSHCPRCEMRRRDRRCATLAGAQLSERGSRGCGGAGTYIYPTALFLPPRTRHRGPDCDRRDSRERDRDARADRDRRHTCHLCGLCPGGGRRDFIADLTPAQVRPHFSNFGPPAERRPFCENSQNRVFVDKLSTIVDNLSTKTGVRTLFSRHGAKRPTLAD